MMFIELLMRPWLVQIKEYGALPRILADDIVLLAMGQQHETNYNSNERKNLLNGESTPASVSTASTQEAPEETPRQTNPRTSIPADAALCVRLHNL